MKLRPEDSRAQEVLISVGCGQGPRQSNVLHPLLGEASYVTGHGPASTSTPAGEKPMLMTRGIQTMFACKI